MKKWITGIAVALMFCLCSMMAAAEEAAENLTFDSFLNDLAAALNARYEQTKNIVFDVEKSRAAAGKAAAAEWEIMGKYDSEGVAFNEGDLKTNEEYLRLEYMAGLKQQNSLSEQMSDEEFWQAWDEGLKRRANVLEELSHVYNLEINSMIPEELLGKADVVTGGYTKNQTLEAYQIQALLGADVDGQPGKTTVRKLKMKQEELGLDINGVVNKERLNELAAALEDTDAVDMANDVLTDMYGKGSIVDEKGKLYENVKIIVSKTGPEIGELDGQTDYSKENTVFVTNETTGGSTSSETVPEQNENAETENEEEQQSETTTEVQQ